MSELRVVKVRPLWDRPLLHPIVWARVRRTRWRIRRDRRRLLESLTPQGRDLLLELERRQDQALLEGDAL